MNPKKFFEISIQIIFILFILTGCQTSKIDKNGELGAIEFEIYLSTLIARRDTLEFSMIFAETLEDESVQDLSNMSFIYERTRTQILDSLKAAGFIYRRIFSNDETSLASYLPFEGGFYDVSTTYMKYNNTHIAKIIYGNPNAPYINSIEFIAIYQSGKWKILTINFFEMEKL